MYVKEYQYFKTTYEIHILMKTSEQRLYRLQMIEGEFSHHTSSSRRWIHVFIVVGYLILISRLLFLLFWNRDSLVKETYNLKIPQLE